MFIYMRVYKYIYVCVYVYIYILICLPLVQTVNAGKEQHRMPHSKKLSWSLPMCAMQ